MASQDDIKRLTRRSESLKALSIGEAPVIDPKPFERFPEMAAEIRKFNDWSRAYNLRLKNILSEALINTRSIPP